jgi:hypothetical protein
MNTVAADLVVLTEASRDVLPSGNVITSQADYGYPIASGAARRKVLMWSRDPWTDVDDSGSVNLPGGRFISGTTETAIGTVRVIGVCIPWKDAHVRTGRRDRSPWQDHLAFLEGLDTYLRGIDPRVISIVVGDFNQRIPPVRTPRPAAAKLRQAFEECHILTAGVTSAAGEPVIDHVAVHRKRARFRVEVLDREGSGSRMSDHHGVVVRISGVEPAETFNGEFRLEPPHLPGPPAAMAPGSEPGP